MKIIKLAGVKYSRYNVERERTRTYQRMTRLQVLRFFTPLQRKDASNIKQLAIF